MNAQAVAAGSSLAAAPAGDERMRERIAALEAAFREVHATRMAGLEFLNPQLRVEACGFRAWGGAQVGALVTPWSVMLVILPDPAAAADAACVVEELATGRSQIWSFPSGDYEFHGLAAAGIGHYQQCSLFSPAQEFASHEDARTAANAALDALLAAPAPPATRTLSRRGLLLGR